MKRLLTVCLLCCAAFVLTLSTSRSKAANAPGGADFKEVYTGTIVSMSGRMTSTGFTLRLKDFTSDEDFNRYLAVLVEGDQFDVLKMIRDVDAGSFSPTGVVGRRVNVARKTQLPDGRTRIVVAFERWMRFAEVRNGYRTEDYPFGIMEIIVDAKGKGSGTYIAACAVDLKRDKKSGQYRLELENFGTYPSKVMGVMRRN